MHEFTRICWSWNSIRYISSFRRSWEFYLTICQVYSLFESVIPGLGIIDGLTCPQIIVFYVEIAVSAVYVTSFSVLWWLHYCSVTGWTTWGRKGAHRTRCGLRGAKRWGKEGEAKEWVQRGKGCSRGQKGASGDQFKPTSWLFSTLEYFAWSCCCCPAPLHDSLWSLVM